MIKRRKAPETPGSTIAEIAIAPATNSTGSVVSLAPESDGSVRRKATANPSAAARSRCGVRTVTYRNNTTAEAAIRPKKNE